MTHLLLFTAFVLWYADFEAKDDAQEIAAHREIDHSAQWLTRAAVFGSVWYLLWVLVGKPSTWPLLLGHAFLFSAVFRWRLNRLRGLPYWYLSTSSAYDSVFIMLAIGYVPRAGRIAYAFELTVAAAATMLMVV